MKLRNIAIIAHVDHGKTTLVDQMLKQSGTFRENENVAERVMDSGDLEKERGITILAKVTSIEHEGTRINIVDTPGHADFGGEVERILSMVDGVVLLVDAAEGPLPQTKFVLSKALKLGIRPMVLINKIDRNDARPNEVLDEIFDLFCNLGASDTQLDFPVLYAVGREGWCTDDPAKKGDNLEPLFNLILKHVPEPKVEEGVFKMLVTTLSANPFLGRILTGKIYSGKVKVNMPVKAMDLNGNVVEKGKITKIQAFRGIKKVDLEEAEAGDIISIAGLSKSSVSDTVCDVNNNDIIKSTPIDPPTMSITIGVNTSPLAGQEGDKLTSRLIRDRLYAEAETNVAIRVEDTENTETFQVSGRGELQLGVLIETMRREGFEMTVGRPRVIMKEENGKKLEPFEEVVVDVDDEYSGVVVEKLSKRKGEMKEMKPSGMGKTRLIFTIPSRGLIGYQSEFMTDTRGTGILNRIFDSYQEYKGEIPRLRRGVLISMDKGEVIPYALFGIQDRGIMFVGPKEKAYEGMIVGENAKDNDLVVNVQRTKQLTNVRSVVADEHIVLTPPVKMTLEQMMTYIEDDEYVEVTPKTLRLRKKYLSAIDRKKFSRGSKEEE
ncbi:MAG TPA: translational GTPase TypA [Rickettsiales bacterium]|nr:translational GTPase TypA [Rickettsiales bacterium]